MADKNWDRYCRNLIRIPQLGIALDVSRMNFDDGLFTRLSGEIDRAWRDRRDLEAGEPVNADENRQVGHFWLRNAEIAPESERPWIRRVHDEIATFIGKVDRGEVLAGNGNSFRHVIVIGIGGSALGPQLVAEALAKPVPPLNLHFLDNTDPGGIDDLIEKLGDGLSETLVIVISKSGGTAETWNGMLEIEAAFNAASLDFADHAIAVSRRSQPPEEPEFSSSLWDRAVKDNWRARFELADWVGGRTSVTSAVGVLVAGLMGIDADAFLEGAGEMDEATRLEDPRGNAAMLLALMWHHAGNGRGEKDMVILPYCDRLALLGKYLQQLVMESLGKELDRGGNIVNQGIAVYGNKGSTDQHAYIQQLRDGLNNFFATFIEVRKTRDGDSPSLGGGDVVTGDFLQGFLRGTRNALWENDRESVTISLDALDARSLGALIALFERTVSFYASLIDVNAYHQPGVEAGKIAARTFLKQIGPVRAHLDANPGGSFTAAQVATSLGSEEVELVYHVLNHLAATSAGYGRTEGGSADADSFAVEEKPEAD